MIRRPPRSTLSSSSAASDVYKRQVLGERAKLFAGVAVDARGQQVARALGVQVLGERRKLRLAKCGDLLVHLSLALQESLESRHHVVERRLQERRDCLL